MGASSTYREPLVSIVIPTYNSARYLRACLKSIRRQTYRNIEVVVVDRGSRDGTVEIAREFGARVYVIKARERSEQKNYGARVARGDYLYFVDSDFILHRDVVKECVELARKGYQAVIVLNISDPRPSIWAKARYYERLSYYGSGTYEAARFIKKELFHKVGGFDEELYANEDYDLNIRLSRDKATIGRTKRTFEVHLGEPETLKEFIIRSYYYGYGLIRYFKKNPNYLHLTPIRPTYFRKDFIAFLGGRRLNKLVLILFTKIIQSTSSAIGMLRGLISKPVTNPYV